MTSPQSVSAVDRRSILERARDVLLDELSTRGHLRSCECECGTAGDARVLAAVVKELRAVLAEIEALPAAEGASVSGDLRARVARRWGATA